MHGWSCHVTGQRHKVKMTVLKGILCLECFKDLFCVTFHLSCLGMAPAHPDITPTLLEERKRAKGRKHPCQLGPEQ